VRTCLFLFACLFCLLGCLLKKKKKKKSLGLRASSHDCHESVPIDLQVAKGTNQQRCDDSKYSQCRVSLQFGNCPRFQH
jgi:hypothetical protein